MIPKATQNRRASIRARAFFVAAFFAAGMSLQSVAQDGERIPVKGYIAAAQSPNDFTVDSWHVIVSSDAGFALIDAQATKSDSQLRDAVRAGAYVKVFGSLNRHTHTVTATRVFLRDDWDKKLTGLGVIYRVAGTPSEPLFLADGYQIRIPPSTTVNYSGEIKSIADVNIGAWVKYEGKRDSSGVLVASKAAFLPAKPTQYRGVFGERENPTHGILPASEKHVKKPASTQSEKPPAPAIDPATQNRLDFEQTLDKEGNLTADAGIRYGILEHWHVIPADSALQSRVQRTGARLVPAYQQALAADHPSKIHFRFYAVVDDKAHTPICPLEGLILIPTQVINDFHSDDQIAAVLADGVAYNLQRQAARVASENRLWLGLEASTIIVPVLSTATFVAGINAASKTEVAFAEERGRITLALLDDAGFDPRQAPEAWRQLSIKHGKARLSDQDSFDFPGYLLSVLSLQYGVRPITSASNTSAATR